MTIIQDSSTNILRHKKCRSSTEALGWGIWTTPIFSNLNVGKNYSTTKGQLISKCLFGVFNFFQKNEQKQADLRFHCNKVEFICSFFGRNIGLEKSFRLCMTFGKVMSVGSFGDPFIQKILQN